MYILLRDSCKKPRLKRPDSSGSFPQLTVSFAYIPIYIFLFTAMKLYALFSLLVGSLAIGQISAAGSHHLLCYYDGNSFVREGESQFHFHLADKNRGYRRGETLYIHTNI